MNMIFIIDCSQLCEAIIVTLEDNPAIAQGGRQGRYNKSMDVNGYPSWTSMSNGIWWASGYWIIGSVDGIGSLTAGLYSVHGNQCPFDLQSAEWYYYDGVTGFVTPLAHEINIHCYTGNFPKQLLSRFNALYL